MIYEWREKTGLSLGRKVRTVKMVQPICQKSCSKQGWGWWSKCPHEPYTSLQLVNDFDATQTEDADGYITVEDKGTSTLYRKILNIRQIGVHERMRSKMGVQASLARGYKQIGEFGLKTLDGKKVERVCEYNNCYEANPTIKTEAGHYCKQSHAKAALLKERGLIEEVFDKEKQRRQFNEIPINPVA